MALFRVINRYVGNLPPMLWLWTRSGSETDEGFSPRRQTPHPPSLRSGTFSHKGRREGSQLTALTSSANRCQISGRQLPLAAPEVDGNIHTLVSPISSNCSP